MLTVRTISMLNIVSIPIPEIVIYANLKAKKHLSVRSEYTGEGKVSSTIRLYHNGKMVEEYWGLPKAIEAYNNIK